jgi:hypothetical protein
MDDDIGITADGLTQRRQEAKTQRILEADASICWVNAKSIHLQSHLSLLCAFALTSGFKIKDPTYAKS